MGIKLIISRGLEYLTNDREIKIYNEDSEKRYIRFGDHTAEIEYYEDFICDINKFNHINNLSLLFIVDVIDDMFLSLFNNLKCKNIKIISSQSKVDLKDDNKIHKNIFIFPQILDLKESVDLDSVLFALNNATENQMWSKGKMMVGMKKNISSINSIPLFIIKRFAEFDKCDEFIINIYDEKDISIIDKWYIEEALREYVPLKSTIEIHIEEKFVKEKTLFFLLSAR